MEEKNSNGSKTGQYSIGLGGYHGHHSWVSLLLGYLEVVQLKNLYLVFYLYLHLYVSSSFFWSICRFLQDKGIANIAKEATETATFATLEHYPLGFILSIITLVVIMIFFVTSPIDNILGMLSSKGDINPASFVKVSWGIILALFAMIMIYTGGTQAIQNLLIIAALPFSIVIILMIWSLFKSLSIDHPRTSNKFPNILQYKSSKQKRIEKIIIKYMFYCAKFGNILSRK